jgi:hypothetical protein
VRLCLGYPIVLGIILKGACPARSCRHSRTSTQVIPTSNVVGGEGYRNLMLGHVI